MASRFKVSRPLKTKKASEIAEMLKDIYRKRPLRYPKEIHVDNGSEFKADVQKQHNEKTRMLGMAPLKAVKLDSVELKVKPYPPEEVAPEDGLYRYLYRPGELEEGDGRRATDMIWSWNTFRLDRIVESPGQRVLYYLAESAKRAFVRKELMRISEGTEVPLESLSEW